MGKDFSDLMVPEEAFNMLLSNIEIEPSIEKISVFDSLGRILAEDVTAPKNVPAHDHPFVDGYAVSAGDVEKSSFENELTLKIKDKIFPEDYPTSVRISEGKTTYVACGAPLPEGADAVVNIESAEVKGEEIFISRPVKSGEKIAKKGEDVEEGEIVMEEGSIVRSQDLGLLTGLEIDSVKVFEKPTLSIISVGDELVNIKESNKRDGVPNNYAFLIDALASRIGACPSEIDVVSAELDKVKEKISEYLENSDIVLTMGSCSVGEKDVVPEALDSFNDSTGVVFHGVSVSPGHVAGGGVVDGKPVIMLPGHVVSATMAFYRFVLPLVNSLRGLDRQKTFSVRAKITDDIRSKPKTTFFRVSLEKEGDSLYATPIHGGANVLRTLSKSNAYKFVPPDTSYEEGEELEFNLLSPDEGYYVL